MVTTDGQDWLKRLEAGNFGPLLRRARDLGPVRAGIVAAHDPEILQGVREACGEGIIAPLLIGPVVRLRELAAAAGLDASLCEFIDATDPRAAARAGVNLVHEGRAEVLAKGLVSSADFLRAALDRDTGLRTHRILSHVAIYDIPGQDRLIHMTDGGINPGPDLEVKRRIVENAVDLAHRLGLDRPRVAVLAAVEAVNPDMPATVDAACLAQMARRGQIKGAEVDGPLALDVAIDAPALRKKGLDSPLKGRADILCVPNIEAGNLLGKAIIYFADGIMAGVVCGARVPLVLNSRVDTAGGKLASLTVAALLARQENEPGRANDRDN